MSKKKKKKHSNDALEVPVTIAPNAEAPVVKGSRRSPSKAKKTAKEAATPAMTAPTAKGLSSAGPSDEEIRLRAYFIAERRHRLALPGNADSDWLEAKRQLLAELGPR